MIIFFVAIIALLIGSFAGCVSYRLGKHQPWVLTRSKCPNCAYNLGVKNLIPILSWIFQRGRCSNCHQKISVRYLAIEIIFLLSFLIIFFTQKQIVDARFITLCALATILLIMSIVDIEEYFIPDILQYFLALTTAIFVVYSGGIAAVIPALKGAFLYMFFGVFLYLVFRYLANTEALGIDDIKLLFIAGFLLGASKFLAFILMTGIFGIIFGAFWTKLQKENTFPFAPALCLAIFVNLLLTKFNIVDFVGKIIF